MKLARLLVAGLTLASLSANAGGNISIYEAGKLNPISGLGNSKGNLVLVNGQKAGTIWKQLTTSQDSYKAYESIRLVRDMYFASFGRKSYDGKDADIDVITRMGGGLMDLIGIDLFGLKQNAAWDGTKFIFGKGDQEGLNGFTEALDVIGHEYTHAVIQTSTDIDHNGQSGALGEHLSDVFGEYIQTISGFAQGEFLLGETLLSDETKQAVKAEYGFTPQGLRDMLNPQFSIPPQPTKMSEIPKNLRPGCVANNSNDRCGVHLLAGIPNRAVALAVQKLGWEKVTKVIYVVMTEKLPKNADFATYASETVKECGRQLSGADCAVFDQSFKAVGL